MPSLTAVKGFTGRRGRPYAAPMHRYPIDELPDHPLLGGLDSAQVERLALASERIELEAGETLFSAGDDAARFFVVLTGQLKIFQLSASGQEKVLELLLPGRTFAEAVMFMPKRRYPVFCEALTDAAVCAFSSTVFLQMLDATPETTRRLLAELSMKLRTRLADIEALAFQNATLRVVGYLLGLVPPEAREAATLELPFAKKNVAARLSLQPETLSRVFARLREAGLLETDGSEVRLPDLAALRELAWKA